MGIRSASGFASAAFYKDQLGIVHLKGLIQQGSSTVDSTPVFSNVFRLPTGYRPTNQRVFGIEGSAYGGVDVAVGRINVRSDGMVEFDNDCNSDFSVCSAVSGYLTLDGISFRPDE